MVTMERAELTRRVKAEARRLGFDAVAVAAVSKVAENPLREWLRRRFHGEMGYMERHFEKRTDPGRVVEGARSIVSLALNYYHPYRLPYGDPTRGAISRYASGDDYHDVILDRLKRLYEFVGTISPAGVRGRYYVDTGPVLDKAWASRAGIGWIGKHTNAIAKRRLGSWFFVAEMILNLDLEPDAPATDHCGTCTRCIEACPTNAIVAPYLLDSRRCISYLTIELRGDIPDEFREPMGNLIYGCDICQDVCPWNRKVDHSSVDEFAPRALNRSPKLTELAAFGEEDFRREFRGSPVKRAKWRGLMRNVAVAMGNSGDKATVPALARLLQVDDPMVRRHAAWGLAQVASREARQHLRAQSRVEADEPTRVEIRRQLERAQERARSSCPNGAPLEP